MKNKTEIVYKCNCGKQLFRIQKRKDQKTTKQFCEHCGKLKTFKAVFSVIGLNRRGNAIVLRKL